MKAYREYAALTPWETTMQAQPTPFTSFANQSTELMFSAFALREELDNLDDKGHYPGIGNDRQRLQSTITYLEDTASIRDEEAALMGFTKGKLVSVVELAKQKERRAMKTCPTDVTCKKPPFQEKMWCVCWRKRSTIPRIPLPLRRGQGRRHEDRVHLAVRWGKSS